jgi:glycosyltransferase involved in cell wall biosynthesis
MSNKLNLMCPIGGDSLGIIGINLLMAFRDLNIDVSLFPISINDKLYFNDKKENDVCFGSLIYSNNFDYKAPTLKIWHPHDLAIRPSSGKYYVYIALDNDSLTPSEVHHLNYTDRIFVESDWAVEVLNKYNINSSIHKISLGVNKSIFNISNIQPVRKNDSYIFYSIGKWGLSNSQDFIIKSFDEAFTENDNVQLRLLPDNEFMQQDQINKWFYLIEKSKLKNKIFVYNKLDNQYDIAGFINSADCYLGLNRSSFTGLNILEAMAMNKPIIAINYGNNNMYCNSNNSYIVNMDDLEKAEDNRLFFGEGNWAKLSSKQFDQTVNYMRYVYNNNVRTNPVGLLDSNEYSWALSAKTIISNMLSKGRKSANTTKKRK